MENLSALFENHIISGKTDHFDEYLTFKEFFLCNSGTVCAWLDKIFTKRTLKNNIRANEIRKTGNECFIKKDYEKSLIHYTSSLCYAEPESESYALSYSNKSAVLFEIEDYERCLESIDICLSNKCSDSSIKLKLFIRKAECYHHLRRQKEFNETLNACEELITILQLKECEKTKYLNKLKIISQKNLKTLNQSPSIPLPTLKNGVNKSFLYASSVLKVREIKERGRHVITEKKLNVGDVLFIEKAFSFAPILLDESDTESKLSKCFYCLSDTLKVSVPCSSCTKVIYCNKKCRSKSWQECHQWECLGMQTNFWQEIGVGFPAFRAVLKGLSCHFEKLPSNYNFETFPFGDENNNYRFFNSLVTNFCHMENVTKIVVIATTIVCYLEKYTDFYGTNYSKLNYDTKEDLVTESGAHLCKHIAQLICNANVIHHLNSNFSNDQEISFNVTPVACGIFPSISIMNHSCKPNISLYFEKDTAIVKAIESVEAGGEIFNCYGTNYLFYNKIERQDKCKEVYHFTCDCIICSNPQLEIESYDTFACKNCGGQLLKTSLECGFKCVNCSQVSNLAYLGEIEENISELYSEPNPNEKYVLSCLEMLEKNLYHKHSCFVRIYAILTEIYAEKGDIKELFKYSKLLYDIEKSRLGDYNMSVGIKLRTLVKCIDSCLKKKEFDDIQKYRKEIEDLSQMVDDMKNILSLYFHLGNQHFEKMEFSVNAIKFVLQMSLKTNKNT